MWQPIRTPARKLLATPTPGMTPGYMMPEEDRGQSFDVPMGAQIEGLPEMKPEDYQYFAPLLKESEDEELSAEEQKERKIMRLLLKVKHGAGKRVTQRVQLRPDSCLKHNADNWEGLYKPL